MPSVTIRLLVVEDDVVIASHINDYFTEKGAIVDHAYDGLSAMSLLEQASFDLILLDIGLPRHDGLKVIDYVRAHLQLDTPIFVVSGRTTHADVMPALQKGADDYIFKPFSLEELELRVRNSILRYQNQIVTSVRVCGAIAFCNKTQEVKIHGKLIYLRPKPLLLLSILLKHPDELMHKQRLEQMIWGDSLPDKDALRGLVHALRKTLLENNCDQIETIHGVGYQLHTHPKD